MELIFKEKLIKKLPEISTKHTNICGILAGFTFIFLGIIIIWLFKNEKIDIILLINYNYFFTLLVY